MDCVSSRLSSLSNFGAMAAPPPVGCSRTCSASARASGAEKPTVSGRIGRQGVPACSRSQENEAVKGGRTWKSKRCSMLVSTLGLACAAMPLPHTRRTRASGGSGRWQRASSAASAASFEMRRAFNTASRSAPPTITSGRRSPMPSASHQALACTLAGVAAPDRRSRKCCSSSMAAPFQGWVAITAGPPVEKANSLAPLTAPLSGFQSGLSSSVQRVPGGSGAVKSYSQTRSLAQRPLPVTAGPSQARRAGSGWRRSPKGTTASSKRSVICRTCATSPRGVMAVTLAACAAAASSIPSNPTTARPVTARIASPRSRCELESLLVRHRED